MRFGESGTVLYYTADKRFLYALYRLICDAVRNRIRHELEQLLEIHEDLRQKLRPLHWTFDACHQPVVY